MPPRVEPSDQAPRARAFARGASLQVLRGDTVVVDRLERAATMASRMRGLLGRSGMESGSGLWIDPCPSIHMFFMRFAIDAVFLDKQGVVVRICSDLQPWSTARGGKGAHSVLELPAGAAAAAGIAVDDQLRFREAHA